MNNHNLFYEILSLLYSLMFYGFVKYDNEFETKEKENLNQG